MQCLPWTNGEAIIDKLFILRIHRSLYDLIAAIKVVIEQRVAEIFHVHTYLVRTACFEHALHQRYIPESFEYLIMSSCVLSMIALGVSFE